MKHFYHLVQFILISFLFNIFKLIGFKNSSNLGFLIGKTLGPIVRSRSSIIKNLKVFSVMMANHLKPIQILRYFSNYILNMGSSALR